MDFEGIHGGEGEGGEEAHRQVHVGEAAARRSGGRRGEQQVGTWPAEAAGSTSGRQPPGLPPSLPCASRQREARSHHASRPCRRDTTWTRGAPRLGQPPPGPCEHGQRPARILVCGAAGEDTRRRRLDWSPRRPCPVFRMNYWCSYSFLAFSSHLARALADH
jgi:hypothetical protein